LMIASAYGFSHIVKLLLDNGADISRKTNDGKAAVDLALNDDIKNMILNAKKD